MFLRDGDGRGGSFHSSLASAHQKYYDIITIDTEIDYADSHLDTDNHLGEETVRDNPEEREQIAYFKALALCEGRHPAIRWIHASMNGASASSKAAAARRKAQGQKRGISDVLIPFPTNAYQTLRASLRPIQSNLTDDTAHSLLFDGGVCGLYSCKRT